MGALPVASLLALLAGPEPDTFVHYGRMESVALCRDGSTLVALDNAGFIWAWDRPTGRRFFCRRILEGRELAYRIVCSPDGAWIALAPRSPHLPARIISLKRARPNRSYDHCVSPCFSPDGKEMAAVDGTAMTLAREGEARLWDPALEKEIARFKIPPLEVRGITKDGKTVILWSEEGGVQVWDMESSQLRFKTGPLPGAQCIALSPDQSALAVGLLEGTVSIWDLGTGRERCRTRMGPAGVTAVAWSGDGRTLVWGDRLGGIVFAEGSKGQEPLVFQSRGSPVYHLSISRDGTTADVYGSGGRWRYVGELGREPEKLEVVEKDRPFRLAFESRYFERELSPDGKYAIARVGGGKVLISRVYRNR